MGLGVGPPAPGDEPKQVAGLEITCCLATTTRLLGSYNLNLVLGSIAYKEVRADVLEAQFSP